MPGTTVNYGIEYPCAGDTFDPAAFETWAQGIETAILATQERSELARIRARVSVTGFTSVPNGVTTPLNHGTDLLTHPDITNNTTFLTMNRAGVYMMAAQLASGADDVTLSITGPGTQVISRDLSFQAGAPTGMNVSGLLVMSAGDTATVSALFVPGGGPFDAFVLFSAAFICEV